MPIGWGNSSKYSSGLGAGSSWFTAPSTSFSSFTNLSPTEGGGNVYAYIAAVVIILVILLMFIHYTMYPIFQLIPGGPGFLPIPGFNDAKVYWKPTSTETTFPDLSDVDTSIGSSTNNWSFTLDIVVTNPYTTNGSGYKVLFNRGGTFVGSPKLNSAITGTITDYNVVVALAPNNTDLVVSMLNTYENPENVLVPNIPIQTPFRLGVVVLGNAFEVYLNGRLVRTRTFASGKPAEHVGLFQGPKLMNARVGNLILWKRVAQASEIRYAKPPLMSGIDSDIVPASASCASPTDMLSDTLSTITGAVGL